MSRTDEILDAIDSAVHDWAVSPDAMRSASGRSPEWTYERYDGDIPVVEVQRFGQPWGTFLADFESAAEAFGGFAQAMRRAAEVAVREFGKTLLPHRDALHRAAMRLSLSEGERGHRPRCRGCNPHGNPRPLSINGREYSRRRRNRKGNR